MTTIAPKPDWAPSIWRDKRKNVFLQFRDGQVMRLDATSAALDKALQLFPCVEDQQGYVTGRGNIADHVLRKPIKFSKKTERLRKLQRLPEKRRSILSDIIKRGQVKEDK